MSAFLWLVVALGVGEMAVTIYYGLVGKVPERTAKGMAFNAALMLALAMWAFWLLATGASA